MFDNLCGCKRVYMLGMGGVSMSALAKLLRHEGVGVSGCDMQGQVISGEISNSPNVRDVATSDCVVYSGAIADSDEGRVLARALGVPCYERGEFLGIISQNYDNVIAVAGSHGKTTITAIIGHIFKLAGLNPTVHVGGNVPSLGGNMLVGGKKYFITEACEYRDSFLSLTPDVSVITSVDAEHLDYFKTLDNEEESFVRFFHSTRDVCFVSLSAKKFLHRLTAPVHTYPGENCGVENVTAVGGGYTFDYIENGARESMTLNIYGRHNVGNALGAICVCRHFGISLPVIRHALSTFRTVESRFEILSRHVIRDYAHHPKEIATALETFHSMGGGVVFFQPHTYSRTKALFEDFISVLSGVKELVILPTYPARESYDRLGDSHRLYEALSAVTSVRYMESSEVVQFITPSRPMLFLGAGDIQALAKKISLRDK